MPAPDEVKRLREKHQKKMLKKKNVLGLGVGYKETGGKKTDELSLIILVEKKEDISVLSKKDLVPPEVEGVKTDVKVVGKIVAQKLRTDRWRPSPAGISIGHYAITAGTLGAVVRDATTNELLILSNNHVMANSNDARVGDSILQPGPADGGKVPQDRIADLKRFVKIQYKGGNGDGNGGGPCPLAQATAWLANLPAIIFGSKSRLTATKLDVTNEVDAAVAKPVQDDVLKNELYEIGQVNGTTEAEVGMSVQKSGRTTAVTHGIIDAVDVTVEVGYGASRTARYEHQVLTNDMSDPGDSGSLIVDSQRRAVGLLFAGSDEVTVFSPIQIVMAKLSIKFE